MKPFFIAMLLMVTALPAWAQQPPPADPALKQLEVEELRFMLDKRREQLVQSAREVEALESRLKWVLDNWVTQQHSAR